MAVIKAPDGRVAASPEEVEEIWCQRFLADYGNNAEVTSFQKLKARVEELRDELPISDSGLQLDLPLLAERIWSAIVRAKGGRATGPSEVPRNFLKAAGKPMAMAIAQVAAAGLRDGLPLGWRGGRMAAVPRRPGKPITFANSRGVLCSEDAAKACGQAIRVEVAGAAEKVLKGWQFATASGGGPKS